MATTNTYAIHGDRLEGTGFEDRFEALHAEALSEAAAAREAAGRGRIAGSIGPLVASYRPEVHPPHAEAVAKYAEVARLIGRESAAGTTFSMFGRTGTVIGVIKDFHFQPLHSEIQPLVFLLAPNPYWLGNIVVRFNPAHTAAVVSAIENAWKQVLPAYPFDYRFVDEDYSDFYRREERMGRLLGNFSFLAVFIACLGLFGLASFVVEQRRKEIGIRKVLGASVTSITSSLCREFVRLVVLAMLIAWPLAYFAAHDWLQDFAYRIRLGPAVFLLTGLLALVTALLTVSFQAIRAARANPAEALQYE